MSWAIITLTRNSLHLGLGVKEALEDQGEVYAPQKIIDSVKDVAGEGKGLENFKDLENLMDFNVKPTAEPFKSFIKSIYKQYDGLIFIMAAGIVVRSLEGLLEHKSKDPAVIVMDEKGAFIIPILSGHLGGGNEMAMILGDRLKATPVITTASDVQGKMAVDMLAKNLGFAFDDFNAATKLSGKIVNNEEVTVFTEIPLPEWVGKYIPVVLCDKDQLINRALEYTGGGILVSNRNLKQGIESKYEDELESNYEEVAESKYEKKPMIQLYPKNLIIGIGARKHVSGAHVRNSIKTILQEFGFSPLSIKHFATVDVKEKEAGILKGIEGFKRPLKIITREEIKTVEADFEGSEFIKKTIGVKAVAEPVAYLSSEKDGEFLLRKRKINGLTLALWKENCH